MASEEQGCAFLREGVSFWSSCAFGLTRCFHILLFIFGLGPAFGRWTKRVSDWAANRRDNIDTPGIMGGKRGQHTAIG